MIIGCRLPMYDIACLYNLVQSISKQLVTFKDFIKYLGAIKIYPLKKERGEDDLNAQRQDLMGFF